MTKLKTISLSALSVAAALALAACGGGGDGGSTNSGSSGNNPNPSNPPSTSVPGTVDSPQYAAGSAQLAAMNLLNQYRTQCGFPALKQNTVLDQAAQNHAKYMGLNGAVTDSEVATNQGFTGMTYVDRAAAAKFPAGAIGLGVSVGVATGTGSFSDTQYGQQAVYSLVGGVYHSDVATFPIDTVGIGEYQTQVSSGASQFTTSWLSMSILNIASKGVSNAPATFPCDGVTGVPYKETSEIPMPPNVSNTGWGTPISVMGSLSDVIVLQSASITGPSGAVAVQVLNSDSDPNKLLGKYQAVAYPTSPLQPNTAYSVTINGTVNGTAFSRNFSFTTGNVVG
ncbi:serine protease [Burkholderia territorii]|uniref:CAP domain-containing protein n=1 Tax=Burkholderia territorii TaxID=1503055 RepID=UPI00075F0F32|nr:CAP domain-containing protein [Burkholderia territorii]KVL32117.1 serine protease [Burkholderia territorii]KWE32591.1 serine protease [Burkholderia territorii]KWE46737.1 serine protease [Burkholderia territorii]KWE51168.1 serine protease [Burkholderia territorii]